MSDPRRVVCRQCDSVIRIPGDRLADGPRCPKCHVAIFDGHPFELTAANFERQVAYSDVPLVVDFWAPWCAPCRAMAPVFEQAAARLEPAARFAKLNTEALGQIAARHGIRSIPTLVVFRSGREIARQSGALDAQALDRWLATALA